MKHLLIADKDEDIGVLVRITSPCLSLGLVFSINNGTAKKLLKTMTKKEKARYNCCISKKQVH